MDWGQYWTIIWQILLGIVVLSIPMGISIAFLRICWSAGK